MINTILTIVNNQIGGQTVILWIDGHQKKSQILRNFTYKIRMLDKLCGEVLKTCMKHR